MKRFLTALFVFAAGVPAFGADLGLKPFTFKAIPASAPMSWSGLYLGGNAGYGWAATTFGITPNDPATAAFVNAIGNPGVIGSGGSGFSGGAQAGVNVQLGQSWLAGLEFSWNWDSFANTATLPMAVDTASYRLDWDGAVAGRLGYLITPDWLLYARGGLAFGNISANATLTCLGMTTLCANTGFNNVHAGYTIGGGIEHAFTNQMRGRIQYDYVNLGNQSLLTTNGGAAPMTFLNNTTAAFNRVTAGLNFAF